MIKTIKFINDVTIFEPYEATEDGQKYLDNMEFKKNDIIDIEIWQLENDKMQVLFLENHGEPFGWIMKEDIEIL